MSRYRSRRSGGCLGRLTGFLTTFLFLFAFAAIIGFGYIIFASDEEISLDGISTIIGAILFPVDPDSLPTPVVVAVIPTVTPTYTPSSTPTSKTLLSTWTPEAAQPTATAKPSNTPAPTRTASPIPTFPTKTPTRTPTPTPTFTPTPSPTGPTPTTAPTRSAFPFTKSDTSPFYLQNFSNNDGCSWAGIAGEVLGLARNPVQVGRYRVHVWGEGIGDKYVLVGSAPIYSDSGWELFLSDKPTVRELNVQLESENGTAVSQVYRVQTRSSCDQNLLRIDFVQNH
jgi:hypothetical protein